MGTRTGPEAVGIATKGRIFMNASSAAFVEQTFARGEGEPQFAGIDASELRADPARDGTRSETFIGISSERRLVLIEGMHDAGEIKKSIFSTMNFLLPCEGVLPMHCSANVGPSGDTALFFGLAGKGKTTLSADLGRRPIGDDETREPDDTDGSLIENTRVTHPVEFIENAILSGRAGHPRTIMFLAADAGWFDGQEFVPDPVFGLAVPSECPDVPNDLLQSRSTWSFPLAYDQRACDLARLMIEQFEPYKGEVDHGVAAAAPHVF